MVTNTTRMPISVYWSLPAPNQTPDARLGPGEERRMGWLITSSHWQRKIVAYSPSGIKIFCRIYTPNDRFEGVFIVTVVEGALAC